MAVHTSYSTASSSTPSSNAVDYAQASRLKDLMTTLNTDGSPSQVWTAYGNLLGIAGSEYLPPELHQEVLRRCSPSTSSLRQAIVHQLSLGKLPDFKHAHESRFQAVIQNIRSSQAQPSLDDYNFVLAQFAAIGHLEACWQAYQEILRIGHIPSSSTFGYCLQSIACRLAYPIPKAARDTIVEVIGGMYSRYMADMRKFHVPLNTSTFEFSMRILKETLDRDGFEGLMKWGYGIDLSNPDRVALEYADGLASGGTTTPSEPFPFTTTALNTTIDMLGRLGDISKMVQAFEVLTQPLPEASQHFFDSFEDDDFGVKVDVGSSARFTPPHAPPNTTTYNMLLRYICRTDNHILARHYIIQAKRLDRSSAFRLMNDAQHATALGRPMETIPAPHFSLSAETLLPALGEGNKDKNLGLLKWLSSKMPYLIRRKRADLKIFGSILEETHAGRQDTPSTHPKRFVPSAQDIDVENPAPSEKAVAKFFDIALHVRILKRNIFELEELTKRLDFIIERTHERLKERMGRRVWDGKDVFFLDNRRRVPVPKERWQEVVNFKSKTDTLVVQDKSKPWKPPPQIQIRRRDI